MEGGSGTHHLAPQCGTAPTTPTKKHPRPAQVFLVRDVVAQHTEFVATAQRYAAHAAEHAKNPLLAGETLSLALSRSPAMRGQVTAAVLAVRACVRACMRACMRACVCV